MKKTLVAIAAMFVIGAMMAPAVFAESLSPELVKAKAQKAAELVQAEGDAAFEKLADPNGEFRFGDGAGYVWVQNLDATMIMHPIKPAMNGKQLMDLKDAEGHYMFVAFSEVAEENGAGWVPYVWPKPGEEQSSPKISYLVHVQKDGTDYVIGSGMYDVTASDIASKFPGDAIYEY